LSVDDDDDKEIAMALIVVSDKRYVNRSKAMISLNSKLKRIVMNKTTREMMIEQYKKEFEHVLLLRDPEVTNCFWIRPVEPDQEGARQLNSTSGSTRLISCSLLLHELNWQSTKTETFPISWDPENLAFKVDITKKGGEEKVD
jgi:hypothetical protein